MEEDEIKNLVARIKTELKPSEEKNDKEEESVPCPYCGKKLRDEVTYCPYCGEEIEWSEN